MVTRENGTFTLQSVSPARVRLNVYPMPDGHYIKSILVGNIQAEDTSYLISRMEQREILLSILARREPTIAGTVQDDKQKLVMNAQIVLVPDDRNWKSGLRWLHLSKTGNSRLRCFAGFV